MKCPCNGCGNYYNWKEENRKKFQAWWDEKYPAPKSEPEVVEVINEEWDTPIALSAAELLKLEELKVKLEKKGVTVANG